MNMRTPLTGRVGVGLVFFGAVLLTYALPRLAPRPLVVLDMPVSLSPGHITTGIFTANPDTLFYVDIETDKRFRIPPDCRPRYVLKTRFVLSSDDGQLIVQGSSPWEDTGLTIADFIGVGTRYAFDAEILPGASCLNAGNPRLKAQTHPSPSDMYVSLTWLSVFSVGTGIVLMIRPQVSRRLNKKPIGMSILRAEDIELHPLRRRSIPRMSLPALPFVGLLYSQISLVIVTVLIFFFGSIWSYYHFSVGLFVLSDLSPMAKSRSCGEAWIVRVDKKENWYLNSTKTSPQELAGLLRQQLGSRTNCAIYLDADPSLTYEVAIFAIDEIQTTQAKAVVLLTPKTKTLSAH